MIISALKCCIFLRNDYITERLAQEYPQHYQITEHAKGRILHNRLTGEAMYFDADYCLLDATGLPPEGPPRCFALDALACQVQEDMAVVAQAGERFLSQIEEVTPVQDGILCELFGFGE